MDTGHVPPVADGRTLYLSKSQGRPGCSAPEAGDNLPPLAQAHRCQNHQGSDPIGGVQKGQKDVREASPQFWWDQEISRDEEDVGDVGGVEGGGDVYPHRFYKEAGHETVTGHVD